MTTDSNPALEGGDGDSIGSSVVSGGDGGGDERPRAHGRLQEHVPQRPRGRRPAV